MTRVIEYRSAAGRAVTRAEGRTTWHSFSFGAHYDPQNTGFEALVAHNDEQLPPGTGYPDHPHADLEIVTWVLTGALRHTSTTGSGVLGPGQVQRLRAGSGVVHAEVADGAEPTRFLQAWIRPDEPGLRPDYRRADVPVGQVGSGGPWWPTPTVEAAYPWRRGGSRCRWPTSRPADGSHSPRPPGSTSSSPTARCSWASGCCAPATSPDCSRRVAGS